jgi:hypothetical protein
MSGVRRSRPRPRIEPDNALLPQADAPPLRVPTLPDLRPHAMVVGEPGAGKSSLLRHIVEDGARRLRSVHYIAYVPVRVPARALAEQQAMSGALWSAVSADLGTTLARPLREDFFAHPPLPRAPWLVLVDGLDEVLDEDGRDQVLQAVRRADHAVYRFVVTTRPLPATELRQLPAYWIQRLGPADVKGLAMRWFAVLSPGEQMPPVARFLNELERARIVEREGALPLLVSIACLIYAKDPGRGLPENPARLYEQFMEQLLDGGRDRHYDVWAQLPERLRRSARRKGRAAADELIDRRRELAEYLAAEALANDATAFLDLAVRYVEDVRPDGVSPDQWREIVAELLRRSGPMVEQFGDFEFVHPRIRDYLAACYFARSEEPTPDTLGLAVDPSREAFVLFLAAKWIEQGQDLDRPVRELLDRDDPWLVEVAAAVIGAGVPVGPAIRREVANRLERVTCDPAVRVVDQRLALDRLVQVDPVSGARVLARMARETDDSWAARWLADIDPDRGLAELRRIVADGPDRRSASDRLLEIDQDAGVVALVTLATDPSESPSERRHAAKSLARLDQDRAADLLYNLTVEEEVDFDERVTAACDLAELNPTRGIAVLRDYLARRTDDGERVLVARALGDFAPGEESAALRSIATSRSATGQVRAEAAAWLIRDSRDEALDLLVAMAIDNSADRSSRDAAMMWLHEMTRDRGVPLLERAAEEAATLAERRHAKAALRRLRRNA